MRLSRAPGTSEGLLIWLLLMCLLLWLLLMCLLLWLLLTSFVLCDCRREGLARNYFLIVLPRFPLRPSYVPGTPQGLLIWLLFLSFVFLDFRKVRPARTDP